MVESDAPTKTVAMITAFLPASVQLALAICEHYLENDKTHMDAGIMVMVMCMAVSLAVTKATEASNGVIHIGL